jgi:imidazolonepropionase-like amidohydrolase
MNIRCKHFSSGHELYLIAILILINTMIVPTIVAQETSTVVIKAGTIYPVTAPPIQDGIVLIRNGKIEAVGKDLEIPEGAEVIDATGKIVTPGLIDAFTTLAERGRDDEESVTPDIRAKDAFDFYRKYRRMLAGGVTTVNISPGQRRLISGVGAIVKLAGDSIPQRIVKDEAALRITLGELPKNPPTIFKPPIPPDPDNPILPEEKQLPTTRMAELAVLRKVFTEAQQCQSQPTEEIDSKMEVLLSVLEGKLPLRINCHTAQDIRNAIAFATEFKLKLIIEGATEAYKVVDLINQSNSPVIISGVLQPGRREAKDYTQDIALGRVNPENPVVLARAGIKFAINAPTDEAIPDLQFIAGYAINQGLSPEEALRAVTITPAEILGIADRVGSIEKGKDADLVILSDEPFKIQSIVDKTLINGQIVYTRPVAETNKEKEEESQIAIRVRKIFTGSRGQIDNGLILVKGSKIAYVGETKAIPQKASIIDASKNVVIPGMIDIHSHVGLHWESEPVRMNPSGSTSGPDSSKLRLVSIAKAIVPNDEGFQEVLRSGVTSVLLAPETRGLVSGNAALIKLSGDNIEDMIVKEYAAVKFSMLGNGARLARIWEARDLLKRAKEYSDMWDEYERKLPEYKHRKATDKEGVVKEPDRPRRDANLELLRKLFKREMPALVHANRADEIRNVLKVFRDEYNLDVIILGGNDGYRISPDLKKYDVGVAVGPNIIYYEKGKPINNADLLTQNGLRVAFHTSATSGTQYLTMNAAYAVRYGMDENEAFRAITSYPAELLHVDDRIGSIDAGKDADLVILSGEPFDFTSRVEKVIVNGRIAFDRAE